MRGERGAQGRSVGTAPGSTNISGDPNNRRRGSNSWSRGSLLTPKTATHPDALADEKGRARWPTPASGTSWARDHSAAGNTARREAPELGDGARCLRLERRLARTRWRMRRGDGRQQPQQAAHPWPARMQPRATQRCARPEARRRGSLLTPRTATHPDALADEQGRWAAATPAIGTSLAREDAAAGDAARREARSSETGLVAYA